MGNPGAITHECRQRHHCKSRYRDDKERWWGAGVEHPGTLCPACEKHAFTALGHLWDDYRALGAAMYEPQARVDGPKISGTAGRSIPIPLEIDTLMTAIDDETLRWTIRVTAGDPLPTMPRERVERCVAILNANTGTLVCLPLQRVAAWKPAANGGDFQGLLEIDGVDAVLRLADLHQRAQSVLGLVETTTWLAEACHICGLRTLTVSDYDTDDAENTRISCRSCKNVWSQEQFARLNNPLAA